MSRKDVGQTNHHSLASLLRITALCLLAITIAAPIPAQVSTASLNGTVQDSTGAFVPGAKVSLIQTDTNFTAETTSGTDGAFRVPSIPIGPYTIRAAKEGFSRFEQGGVTLTVGQVATLQIVLNVGATSESVVVTAEVPQVESTTSTIQNVVEGSAVSNIPLNGRNPASLMNIVPGVVDAASSPGAVTANSTVKPGGSVLDAQSAPTTNGVRPGGTYFSLDGAGNVDPWNVIGGPFPNPDATQEFGVVTGSYGARYVSAPGGAVNIVTKSGTNQFHGSVFEFLRNGAVNARNAFAVTPDILKRNQYGFGIGGPIIKDKLFFFGSYQGTNTRSSTVVNSWEPSADMRAGKFTSSSGETITVPVSKVVQNLFKYIPLPNDGSYFRGSRPYIYDQPEWTTKVDYSLGGHRLFARYFGFREKQPAQEMVNNNAVLTSAANDRAWDTVAVADTWASKGGGWIIDARASVIKVKIDSLTAKSLNSLGLNALGATNVTPATNPTLSTFYAGNFIATGGSGGQFPRTSWDYTVDVQHLAGKHQLAFGTNLRFASLNEVSETGQNPAFLFYGAASRILYGSLDNNTIADLVMGKPTVFFQQDGYYSKVNGKLFGFYAEDKYRLSDRVTLTGGLRWDPYIPFSVANNALSCWNPGQQSKTYINSPVGLIYPGDQNCPAAGTTAKYGMVQPRIGLAYKLDQSGKTALRAGWGVYETQFQMQSLMGFSAPPYVRSYMIINPFQSVDNPWGSNGLSDTFADGFHTADYKPTSDVSFANPIKAGFNVSAIAPDFKPAYVNQWTLSLQRSLSRSDSFEVAYVGTQGIHNAQTYDANLPVNGPGASTANEQARRPYGSLGLLAIRVLRSDSNSNYHGLNVTYRHRGKGGLDYYAGFNYSRCMDDGTWPASTNSVTENTADPRTRHGRCDFDVNYSFRSTAVWTSPGLKAHSQVLQRVAGSWIVSGLLVANAGMPFSVVDTADYSYTGNNLDLADRVASQPVYVNGQLNYAAFAHNAPGTFGNSGRNAFRGPGSVTLDPAVMKIFPLFGERTKLMVRAEAFNAFNHTNLLIGSSVNYNGDPKLFGVMTSSRDPRILQFSLKILF